MLLNGISFLANSTILSRLLPYTPKTMMMLPTRSIITFLTILWIGLFNFHLSAQAPTGTDALWSDLEEQIQKGNRRALRDLATFLDKPAYADATRQTLIQFTFFTKKEINLATISREDFLVFFYEHEQELKFSEILRAFYLTPVEKHFIDTNKIHLLFFNPKNIDSTLTTTKINNSKHKGTTLYFLKEKFDSLAQKNFEYDKIQDVIEKISALQTHEAYDWLRRTLNAERFGPGHSELYLSLCEALKNDPSEESLKAILKATEHGLVSSELLSSVFLEITNCATSATQVQQLLDTLGSLEAVKNHCYDRSLTFKEAFFYEKVDYYGKILSTPNAPHWIQRNGLRDLLATHHPRLLFFIAAQVRLKPNNKDFYIHLLQKLTQTELHIDKQQEDNSDTEKWKDFVRWWAVHAEDFEWDETSEHFTSRAESTARTEELERLFHRLESPNDSVALSTFVQLAENTPSVVMTMMEKFRPLLRSYNPHLPEMNYPFLENMSKFVVLCRQNNISYYFKPPIDSLWTKLLLITDPKLRYSIENQIIEKITLPDIAALEFNGLLYSSNLAMNFSVSRIIDIFYSKNWKQIIFDNDELRIYLKKSILFSHIGTTGVSSLYERKLDRTDRTLRERLENIASSETDFTLQRSILTWLNPPTVLRNEDFTEVKPIEKIQESINEKIQFLESESEIQIDDINDFVSNPAFSDFHKNTLILCLKKIRPLSSLRHFKLKNYLSTHNDLLAFSDIKFTAKDLDDFLCIFKVDDENLLWAFVNIQKENYSTDELGLYWNSMFKITWFNDLIYHDAMLPSERDTIIKDLHNYLINSELLSDFEEQLTQTHIAELENIGRTLSQKLEATLVLDANNATKAAVQSAILARIKFEDIGIVASFSDRLNRRSLIESPMHFLQTDFGIPIFTDDSESMKQLIEKHKTLSPKAFYSFYLKQFGVDIWKDHDSETEVNESLDYEKINSILKYESVIPFTGGGEQREYFTFGVIKLLEFEFGTNLGFHEKLNENQTFYTYNTGKRALAWRQYLLEKKQINPTPSVPASYKD